MLLPQFSLRLLFALTAVCGLASLVVALAIAGRDWAVGLSVGLGSLAVVATVHGLLFLPLWLVSLRMRSAASRSSLPPSAAVVAGARPVAHEPPALATIIED